ncbi:hypothetical protein BXO88_04035 [Oribacterium sp. C9]|uniref:DEAD/DEAH box helicase n=1 Tax=Oribacterium sp. C9 TaxID=1943579 RepID=UPI00098F07A9|nr:DEAD/DEAH box helicase [Oribacterium sp. C9]OON87450.1 hypothetical protein BXO88_04035 [Oribacterium sp. C9]
MSDLILNINISESRKKGRIVLETYDGTIPHLKNKQYSGPLRNANINGIEKIDNLSSVELELIRNYLSSSKNVQVNKYQHILSDSGLRELAQFAKYGCLFYKDKSTSMNQVETVEINGSEEQSFITVGNAGIAYNKTELFLRVDEADEDVARQISSKAYVNINTKDHPLELVFEYDDFSVNYESEERIVGADSNYRDFGYEERVVSIVKRNNWNYTKNIGFIYCGKDFPKDIANIMSDGINVYIDKKTQIARGDFSNIQVSYGIDWFDVNGTVEIDGQEVNVADLFDFKQRKDNWVEFNGKVFALPGSLGTAIKTADKVDDGIRIGKKGIINAVEIAFDTNGGNVIGIDNLINYSDTAMSIDKKLLSILREYQVTGVRWLLSLRQNGFGGCLADDMGLGKTLQVISYLSDASMNKTKNLIVVPKTLLINWEKEFAKFSPDTEVLVYHGSGRDSERIAKYKVVITTYGTALNDIDEILKVEFDNLIIDEAQYIKNSKSKNHRAIKRICAKTKFILTGTPVENNIQEYLGLMQLINPEVFCKNIYKLKNVEDAQRVEIVRKITSPFLLRRMKKDVLKDLPLKQEQVLYCTMDSEQRDLYTKMLQSIRYEINKKNDRFEIKSNSLMLNGLLYLEQICCHPQLLDKTHNPDGCRKSAKFDQLLDILENLYDSGHKVVIFSRFTKMLQMIEKQVAKRHYNYFYLDGKTNNRMDLVEEFEESETGIFLISLKAGGTGLNLVSADTVIIYDPWWNPASEKQAEDRIYRIGQKKNVMIYRMIVEDSIEEKVQRLQKEKTDLYEDLLNGHETPMGLTAEIMQNLFMAD